MDGVFAVAALLSPQRIRLIPPEPASRRHRVLIVPLNSARTFAQQGDAMPLRCPVIRPPRSRNAPTLPGCLPDEGTQCPYCARLFARQPLAVPLLCPHIRPTRARSARTVSAHSPDKSTQCPYYARRSGEPMLVSGSLASGFAVSKD